MTIFLEIFFLFVIKNLGLDPDSATTCIVYTDPYSEKHLDQDLVDAEGSEIQRKINIWPNLAWRRLPRFQ